MSLEEKQECQALREAYLLVQACGNSAFIAPEGLEKSVRIQAYLCKRYNSIVLKGWQPC